MSVGSTVPCVPGMGRFANSLLWLLARASSVLPSLSGCDGETFSVASRQADLTGHQASCRKDLTSSLSQGSNVMEEQDLREIGISDPQHRRKLLQAARSLPKVTTPGLGPPDPMDQRFSTCGLQPLWGHRGHI